MDTTYSITINHQRLKEQWKPIAGFDELYQISSSGLVCRTKPGKNTWPGKILRQKITKSGYAVIGLTRTRKTETFYIHHLVAQAFLAASPDKEWINHIDGNKLNNSCDNLEYVTPAENCQHAGKTGLLQSGDNHWTRRNPERWKRILSNRRIRKGEECEHRKIDASDVLEIRRLHSVHQQQPTQIARQFKIHPDTVRKIIKRIIWKHI